MRKLPRIPGKSKAVVSGGMHNQKVLMTKSVSAAVGLRGDDVSRFRGYIAGHSAREGW